MAKTKKSQKSGKNNLPLLDASIESLENPICSDFLEKLKNEYGYLDEQIAVNQKSDEFEVGLGWAKADIVVWKTVEEKENNSPPFIVVQGKFQDGLRLEDYFEGIEFAKKNKATLFVTIDDRPPLFYKYDLENNNFISIETPDSKELKDENKFKVALTHDEKFKREQFRKRLFACHNVIRNNDKFSPEMAFDEISKVMFVKIYIEQKERKTFTKNEFDKLKAAYHKIVGNTETPYYQHLFNQTKNSERFRKDEIFEETDKLRLREESFSQIIKELESYNLSEIFDDVKGLAFEEFLGTTFRGDLGQFFTPRTVVDFMAEILDPQENELIADPCCGSGGFLIKSFDLVKDAITEEIKNVKVRLRRQIINENFPKLNEEEQKKQLFNLNEAFSELNLELKPKSNISYDNHDPESRLYKLSNNCIFGTDAEPRSARTAKMNMIMRGDGHSGVHHHDGLLHVNGMLRENFDVILTNPPFGARISRELLVSESDTRRNEEKLAQYKERYGDKYLAERNYLEQNQSKPVLELFDTGKKDGEIKSTLTEVVFMERCLDLLKKGGRMGIVLPEGFLNTMDLQNAREYFEGRAKLILIASIPQDVFIAAGATVKPSLVFLKRFSEAEEIEYQKIKEEVTAEIDEKYQPQIDEIEEKYQSLQEKVKSFENSLKESKANLKKKDADKEKLKFGIDFLQMQLKGAKDELRRGKKERDKQLAEIENRKKREIVQGIKDKFDYEIPIVQAEYAGVTSTGAKTEKNDFELIEPEFKQYRQIREKANDPLWLSEKVEYEYSFDNFVLERRLKPIKKVKAKNGKPKVKVSVTTEIDFND